MKPLIAIDEKIPYLRGVLEPYARCLYAPGDKVARHREADAWLVRTRTACGPTQLAESAVTYIASATIGTDHVDLAWCAAHGIKFDYAPGCNACGVLQYVYTALWALASKQNISLKDKTIGVIGAGHVGAKVADLAPALGLRVLVCDPPRAAAEGHSGFVSLQNLLSLSDIVTLHVPLDSTTRAMAGKEFFAQMKPGAVFINAARGPVVDDAALLDASSRLGGIVIDCWNLEPHPNPEVLKRSHIATPHIAGYSVEGKMNATEAVVRGVARHFGWMRLTDFGLRRPLPLQIDPKITPSMDTQESLHLLFREIFPIFDLDKQLRDHPGDFENLRGQYPYRREWAACKLSASSRGHFSIPLQQAIFKHYDI